jgi:hypothetical protein
LQGSDDCALRIWDAESLKEVGLIANTGHHNNIFAARLLPGTDTIVSCAADGQVCQAIEQLIKSNAQMLALLVTIVIFNALLSSEVHVIYALGSQVCAQHIVYMNYLHICTT